VVHTTTKTPRPDRDVLRRLAERKMRIATDPVNEERRAAWLALDSGSNERVMVLAEHIGVRDEHKPCSASDLECSDEWARRVEATLLSEISQFEDLRDDHVIEPVVDVHWQVGYTADLPQDGAREVSSGVSERDLWVLIESQETVGVGPELFQEFVFPYHLSIAQRFGKTYYGCCEPVHNRWHVIRQIPNLARVSVSPWADQEFLSDALGRDYVFSRKPNPTLISTGTFDEAAIRADLRHTLEVSHGNRVEIIMKDVHTLNNEPERLARWVEIAREEIDKVAGQSPPKGFIPQDVRKGGHDGIKEGYGNHTRPGQSDCRDRRAAGTAGKQRVVDKAQPP